MSFDLSESFEKSFDESIYDILDQISPYIDQTNSEAIDLFSQLHVSPNSPDSQEKLNLLFNLISQQNNFEQINATMEKNTRFDTILKTLLSQSLSIFKSILKSTIHKTKLNSIQKQIISLHTRRIENYFSTHQPESASFSDFIQKNVNIPLQIQELNQIQTKAKKEKDPKVLHFYIDILFHICETILIFNDFIIKENHIRTDPISNSSGSFSDDESKITIMNELQNILYDNQKPFKNLNQQANLNSLVEMLTTKVANLNDDNKQMKKAIGDLTANKLTESTESNYQTAIHTKEVVFLKEQISILQDQLSVSQHISDEKSQTIDELTNKIQALKHVQHEISGESSSLNTIKGLHTIIEESTNQLELCKKAKLQSMALLEKAKTEIQRLSFENDELKAMLQRSARETQKQILDNATLLKHLRRQKEESSDDSETVQELKEQLRMAQFFIQRLQKEIESCRDEIMIHPHRQKSNSSYRSNSFDSIDPILDDFDKSLSELDETINKSKKANEYYS